MSQQKFKEKQWRKETSATSYSVNKLCPCVCMCVFCVSACVCVCPLVFIVGYNLDLSNWQPQAHLELSQNSGLPLFLVVVMNTCSLNVFQPLHCSSFLELCLDIGYFGFA